jgi:trimethylamine--corrinoid protein Co-methyltransferase
MLVLSDETISMVKRIMRGIQVHRETLALDVAERVGIGGNFLQDSHTLDHFREEVWSPTLLDRQMFESWKNNGSKTLGDRCREKVMGILEDHQPDPMLDDKLVAELKGFIQKIEGN